MPSSDRETVAEFLFKVKEAMTVGLGGEESWHWVPRRGNNECIAELGFTLRDVKDVILDLSVADYCDGPCQDRDEKGDVWIFGTVIEGSEVYIKLKLTEIKGFRWVRVMSFHFSSSPLTYPFGEK
ncbi:MAG: hypothetical protein ACLFPU_06700 [Dehalococcoidia bacterium]